MDLSYKDRSFKNQEKDRSFKNQEIKNFPWQNHISLTNRPDLPVRYPEWTISTNAVDIGFITNFGDFFIEYFLWSRESTYHGRYTVSASGKNLASGILISSTTDFKVLLDAFNKHHRETIIAVVTSIIL